MPDEVSEEICPECGRNLVVKSGRFGRFLACPGYPDCSFTMPLVVEMPGRCPKCGGRLMKRTGKSKKTGKQYTYYCCEHMNSKDEAEKCDFMTWDVPVKDDCPVCGHTMFKKAGKGFKKPFCINPECSNFLPEEKRGYPRKKTADSAEGTEPAAPAAEEPAEKKARQAGRRGQEGGHRQDHGEKDRRQEAGGQDCREKDDGQEGGRAQNGVQDHEGHRQKDGHLKGEETRRGGVTAPGPGRSRCGRGNAPPAPCSARRRLIGLQQLGLLRGQGGQEGVLQAEFPLIEGPAGAGEVFVQVLQEVLEENVQRVVHN